MNVLSFGEIIWDVYENEKFIGGAPFNLAAHCSKQGANAFMLSAVGNDDLGKAAIKEVKKQNVKTAFISTLDEKQTGQCIVTLDKSGVPSYNVLTDTAYDYIKFPETARDLCFDVFCFGTLALRSEANRATVQKALRSLKIRKVYCDVNIRPPFFSDEVILFALENANILKISDEELHYVYKACGLNEETAKLSDIYECFQNLDFILLTQGEKGAVVYECKAAKLFSQAAPEVTVGSSVGAGDSFGATFLCEFEKTKDVKKSLSKAIEISAFVVSKKEAIPEY